MENKVLLERKTIRWDKQDYSHPGEYMITVCTKDMKQILSKIVVDTERAHHDTPLRLSNSRGYNQTVGDDVPVVPRVELLPYGLIADKYINQLNVFYKNINVIKYVIMPNHIHLLLQIPDGTKEDLPRKCLSAFVGTPNRTSSPTDEQTDVTNGEKTSSPTGEQTDVRPVEHSVIADFISTFKRFVHRDIGEKIFQRSYHDHVIRDENDYIGAVNYIENNPYRWIDKN